MAIPTLISNLFSVPKAKREPFAYEPISGKKTMSKESDSISEKSSDTADDDQPFLGSSYGYLRREKVWYRGLWTLPWILSTIILAGVSTFLSVKVYHSSHGTYEYGFNTDFQTITNLIEIQEVRFTKPPTNITQARMEIDWDENAPRYVGIPTPEMDQEWNKLTGPFMQLTPEEALDLGAALQNGHYWTTTTVQHTLHCLNHLRQALYGEKYYPKVAHPPSGELDYWPHINHCVDILRQALMCTGDLTPVPLTWNARAGIYGADVERVHTCRKYDPLIKYIKTRKGDQ